jgi:hypothetical protein
LAASTTARQAEAAVGLLAKTGEAVKIADAGNQRNAKRETVSAVAAWFREDTKPFYKADSVFSKAMSLS